MTEIIIFLVIWSIMGFFIWIHAFPIVWDHDRMTLSGVLFTLICGFAAWYVGFLLSFLLAICSIWDSLRRRFPFRSEFFAWYPVRLYELNYDTPSGRPYWNPIRWVWFRRVKRVRNFVSGEIFCFE
jgi:hypothetical protein